MKLADIASAEFPRQKYAQKPMKAFERCIFLQVLCTVSLLVQSQRKEQEAEAFATVLVLVFKEKPLDIDQFEGSV